MLKKLRRSKFKGIKKELWMSLYSNLKRLRGSKNKLKKKVQNEAELKAKEIEKKKNQKNQKRNENF